MSKKRSIKDVSKEVAMLHRNLVPNKKLGKIKLFILNLLGIKLKPVLFVVGDLLKRTSSEDPTELYEVKDNLLDKNFDRVLYVYDMKQKQFVVIYERNFESFKVCNGVIPGTLINPADKFD
jgi:hypothetical protein